MVMGNFIEKLGREGCEGKKRVKERKILGTIENKSEMSRYEEIQGVGQM